MDAGEPGYFRFAYLKYGLAMASSVGQFTKPGTWRPDGTWVPPELESAE